MFRVIKLSLKWRPFVIFWQRCYMILYDVICKINPSNYLKSLLFCLEILQSWKVRASLCPWQLMQCDEMLQICSFLVSVTLICSHIELLDFFYCFFVCLFKQHFTVVVGHVKLILTFHMYCWVILCNNATCFVLKMIFCKRTSDYCKASQSSIITYAIKCSWVGV